jgi:hypothetical protein
MQAHRKALQSLLSFTPENQAALSTRVASVLEETRGKTSQDVWKSQWELLLKSEILTLAVCSHFPAMYWQLLPTYIPRQQKVLPSSSPKPSTTMIFGIV